MKNYVIKSKQGGVVKLPKHLIVLWEVIKSISPGTFLVFIFFVGPKVVLCGANCVEFDYELFVQFYHFLLGHLILTVGVIGVGAISRRAMSREAKKWFQKLRKGQYIIIKEPKE